jgi:hypothetical protein
MADAYVGQALAGLGELTATEDPARARALFERAVVVQASVGRRGQRGAGVGGVAGG